MATETLTDNNSHTAPAPAQINLTIDDDLAHRLAAFTCRHPEMAERDAAIRHILRLWLTENGFDGAHKDAGTRPEALNASNDD